MSNVSDSAEKFLQRGKQFTDQSTAAALLNIDSSLLVEDETGPAALRSCSPARSPKPTQLTQQGPSQHLSRQRPRFHTVQDLDLALNQAIEGRINSKNAWASKEASDLLEGITHTIESTLEANASDNYSGFTKAATVVEGCSKVWTIRVDSTYHQSNQMVRRLLRNQEGSNAERGEEGEGSEQEENDGAGFFGRSKTKKNSAASMTLARTLCLNADEINLDNKSKTALTQSGINAQFRAITEKFDQGNAHGLLMNNAPLGSMGNLILDVDYSRYLNKDTPSVLIPEKDNTLSRQDCDRLGGDRFMLNAPKVENDAAANDRAGANDALQVACSSWAYVEEDAEADAQVTDLPVYIVPSLFDSISEGRTSDTRSTHQSRSRRASIRGRGATELLMLPHAAIKHEIILTEQHNAGLGNTFDDHRGDPAEMDDAGCDFGGNDDWGEGDDVMPQEDTGPHRFNESHQTKVSSLEVGACELEEKDSDSPPTPAPAEGCGIAAGTVQQLALEAEDPSSWCSLADIPARSHFFFNVAPPRSELSRLHREHKLLSQAQRKHLESGVFQAPGEGINPSPPSKRAKKQRTVVFDLVQTSKHSGQLFSTKMSKMEHNVPSVDLKDLCGVETVLKQSTTPGKNMTPLGKEILMQKDAAAAAMVYTQSATQRSKAEEANLVLPPAPVPGKTIPDYLPYPVDIPSFFQPFSTEVSQWNLLHKSASGQLIIDTGRRNSSLLSTERIKGDLALSNRVGQSHYDEGDTGEPSCLGDMPMEYFPTGADMLQEQAADDYMGYDLIMQPEPSGSDNYDIDELQRQEHQRLLTQFEAQAVAATIASSTRTSRSEEGGENADFDPADVVRIFRSPDAFVAAQVDVVKLREVMWETVKKFLRLGLKEETLQPTTSDARQAESDAESSGSTPDQSERANCGKQEMKSRSVSSGVGLLKLHMQSVLQPNTKKRHRVDLSSRTEEERYKATEETVEFRRQCATRDNKASYEDSLEHRNGELKGSVASETCMIRFSEVVAAILNVVPNISSTGTLSPAFFFFSILFLANEHSLGLENESTLGDLIIHRLPLLSALLAHDTST